MYAIVNTRTGKFVYGSDWRYRPPHQRTSADRLNVYDSENEAHADFFRRKCGWDYQIVEIKMTVEILRHVEPKERWCRK